MATFSRKLNKGMKEGVWIFGFTFSSYWSAFLNDDKPAFTKRAKLSEREMQACHLSKTHVSGSESLVAPFTAGSVYRLLIGFFLYN